MSYVDGFLVPVPKTKVNAYLAMARTCGPMWMEHGALQYFECAAEDVKHGQWTDFYRVVDAKEDETVFFSFIIYPSRAARDACMAALMPKLEGMFKAHKMPFDGKRMVFGGFRTEVELKAG